MESLKEISEILADTYRTMHSEDVKAVAAIQRLDVAAYEKHQKELEWRRYQVDKTFVHVLELAGVPDSLIPQYVGELHGIAAHIMWFWEPEQPEVLPKAFRDEIENIEKELELA